MKKQTKNRDDALAWLAVLRACIEAQPLTLVRFTEEQWERLSETRKGPGEFTDAHPHELLASIKPPALAYITGEKASEAFLGIVSHKQAVTTLLTRIKVKRGSPIVPTEEKKLKSCVSDPRLQGVLTRALSSKNSVIRLSPKLSIAILEGLAKNSKNEESLKRLAYVLDVPKHFSNNAAFQEDAVKLALKAFELSVNDSPAQLELSKSEGSSLARLPVIEDSVIEHDARTLPGFTLNKSFITGRAVFVRGSEQLEIFTANKRPLEETFGVDLIYWNKTRGNLVMLQYKMLEKETESTNDWVYRPNRQLTLEIKRMKKFAKANAIDGMDYRLNSSVFYLKFVKRDQRLDKSGIVMPLEHYEIISGDPDISRGKQGALCISYEKLNGRYFREVGFLDLVKCGYIGSKTETTAHFVALIQQVLDSNRAIVAAVARRK